ncbi:type VI secretion system baseplate subunit TssF [Spirosoma sp.]|uniref:type VI secretion system baseplate subunit TssF n=1 Tax=Spirosoma sp. TaxID=1899569 RepID=UPI003B3B9C4A
MTNLGSDTFTRDRVKTRMLRRAADLWGYAESDLDSFDPLVAMLIEACSVEFERVSVELGNTQTRLLDRLAQVLHPEPDVAHPAFAVVQVRSLEPQTILSPTVLLGAKRAAEFQANQTSGPDTYFSAVQPYSVVNGSVQYVATTEAIIRIDDATQKTSVAQRQGNPVVQPYQSVWIGLELADDVASLEGVTFFFDWPDEAGSTNYYSALAQSSWLLNGQELQVQTGMPEAPTDSPVDLLFDGLKKREKQAMMLYNRQFITIKTAPTFRTSGQQKETYPKAIGQWFSERDLRMLKEPLWWIELRISHTVSKDALLNSRIGINCFPVLNRRLQRITYRLQQTLNIIPLETDRYFLAMRDVRTSQNKQLTAIPLGNLSDLSANTYMVRYGVSRFDDRDARQTLVNLLDLLHDESASFSALGEDFLTAVLRELDQALARLEVKVEQKTRRRDAIPYLIVKAQQPGETVYIDYWTCDGETANRIPAGSRLTPSADNSLRKDASFLMTTTSGGRGRPTESEKISQYKRSLLTRNRIVTLEDVRAVCQAELGGHLRSVQVERTFRVDALPANGFQRCIRVRLEPSASSAYTAVDWREQANLLTAQLQEQSVAALPYQVEVITN